MYQITALPLINMHPQTLVPGTAHYTIQEAGKEICLITLDMRSIPELSSVVASLIWFPSVDIVHRIMRYVMFGFSRVQQAHLCQEFGSVNDVRPCIQPHTASSFPNTTGFSTHLLVTKLQHAALQDPCNEDGMHGERCMADAVRDLGVVILGQ